jgi:hypothetical protein
VHDLKFIGIHLFKDRLDDMVSGSYDYFMGEELDDLIDNFDLSLLIGEIESFLNEHYVDEI